MFSRKTPEVTQSLREPPVQALRDDEIHFVRYSFGSLPVLTHRGVLVEFAIWEPMGWDETLRSAGPRNVLQRVSGQHLEIISFVIRPTVFHRIPYPLGASRFWIRSTLIQS